jgi:hypothetical protein
MKNPYIDDKKLLNQNFFINYTILQKFVHKDIKLLCDVMQLLNAKARASRNSGGVEYVVQGVKSGL